MATEAAVPRGTVGAGFERVRESLTALAETDASYCAQFAAFHRGAPIVDLACGSWADDALLPVFSAGKGAIGVTIATLVQRGRLDLDATVADYWPEFAARGKQHVSVRQLLSHQAGLPTVDGGFTASELLEHDGLAARLADQRPYWWPGSGFAYHAVTIGTLADELVRRATGRTLGEVFNSDIAAPRGIDLHLGLAEHLDDRVETVDAPTEAELATGADSISMNRPDSLRNRIAPADLWPVWTWVDRKQVRRVGPPALGGLATARGLAAMYASLTHDLGEGRLVDDDVLAQVTQQQVDGKDLLTSEAFRYGVIFQRPLPPKLDFGSSWAFGHDGLGGSIGVYDPFYDLAFGYTVKRIPVPPCCDARALRLMAEVRAALASDPAA